MYSRVVIIVIGREREDLCRGAEAPADGAGGEDDGGGGGVPHPGQGGQPGQHQLRGVRQDGPRPVRTIFHFKRDTFFCFYF